MQIIRETDRATRYNILMKLLALLGFSSIVQFQRARGLSPDGLFGINSWNTLYRLLLRVQDIPNFGGHFFSQVFPKNQIVWHHSASWDNASGMFDWWRNDGVTHVATAIGITDDGTVWRGYDESFWAHHIGMRHVNNLARNQQSVAVEICNWGNLTERNGRLFSWANAEVPQSKAIELNFKGSKFYEIYTDAEIESLKIWTLLVAMRFDIPLAYRERDMWEVSQNAINGVAGIYTHNSFPVGKNDVSPQPKLIAMAKSLKDWEV